MSLVRSKGNMYDWVTHVHTHLGGECAHRCPYCYVGRSRFGRAEKYTGPVRLLIPEFGVRYGSGRTIFVEHMNDLFAPDVRDAWIEAILEHCREFPFNDYVFQSKNPRRAFEFLSLFPPRALFGTTIETNRGEAVSPTSTAPRPAARALGLRMIRVAGRPVFVTIEPVMEFDADTFAAMIMSIRPRFVNIGADSKRSGLKEPSADSLRALIELLGKNGVTIRKKVNLGRLLE